MLNRFFKMCLLAHVCLVVSCISAMDWVCQTAHQVKSSFNRVVSCCTRPSSDSGSPQDKIIERSSMLGLFKSRHARRTAFALSLYRRSKDPDKKFFSLLPKYSMKEICDMADMLELSGFGQEEKNKGLIAVIDGIGNSRKEIYAHVCNLSRSQLSRQAKDEVICDVCKKFVHEEMKYKVAWMVPLFISAGADSETVCSQIEKQKIEEMAKNMVKKLHEMYGLNQ